VCDLCGPDPKRGVDRCHRLADALDRMAAYYRDMAEGRIKPHSKDCVHRVVPTAKGVIRDLVEEWI
jgi:hypothetical protein